MEGRRIGRDGGGVAGGCKARARGHVHTSGGRKRGRVGRAGISTMQGCWRRYFSCGSRVAAVPLRTAMRSHASVNALRRATATCHSAPQMREWVPPAAIDLPQPYTSSQS